MLSAILLLALQQSPPADVADAREQAPATESAAEASKQRIAWYTTWEQALSDAKRLNRPILLQSAAPQCSGVPGMW